MISGISGPVCITPTSPRNSTKIQKQTIPYYSQPNQTLIETTLKAFQICIILCENLNQRLFEPVLFCSSFSEIMHFAVYAVLYVLHFDRHPTYPILSTLHCYMICICTLHCYIATLYDMHQGPICRVDQTGRQDWRDDEKMTLEKLAKTLRLQNKIFSKQ